MIPFESSVWSDPFLIPAYLAAVLLIGHASIAVTLPCVRKVRGLLRDLPIPSVDHSTTSRSQAHGFFTRGRQNMKAQDMTTIVMNFLRLFGSMMLVAFSITVFFTCPQDELTRVITPGLDQNLESKQRCETGLGTFTHSQSIEIINLVLYSYTSLMAIIILFFNHEWRAATYPHFTMVMLTVVAIYTYRDLYPLATFTLIPKDAAQGGILWFRIGVASLIGALIPLITPRVHHPVDPLNSERKVNTEQTASWLSLLTYTFLDPIIWLAARTPHLEYTSLPPLADYDEAAHLVAKSEKMLDPYFRRKNNHIFWGLMHFFASEFAQLALMIIIKSVIDFMAPLGIYQLLAYLQTDGKDATIRPWVWILYLFCGPSIGSVVWEYYNFLNTRNLVRTEAILTQLIFDHALRIRLKENADSSRTLNVLSNIPDTQSIAETERDHTDSEERTTQNGVHSSTDPSTRTVTTTGKNVDATSTTTPAADPDGDTLPSHKKTSSFVGEINNFVTTDLRNITEGRDFLMLILLGPLQAVLCVIFLYKILGWSALVGMLVMVLGLPISGYVGKLMNDVQGERMTKTDARVQTVTEIFSVIRMIKLFGWEQKVEKQISDKREVELQLLKKRQFLNLMNDLLIFVFPILTMLVSFATYTTIQGKDLNASILFSSIAVFDKLMVVLHGTLFSLPNFIDAKVSLDRINNFLLNVELLDRFTWGNTDKHEMDPSQRVDSEKIGFRNATFCWTNASEENGSALSRQTFRLIIEGELFFKVQKLNLVIGPTGSGKTSVLMALLGEMHYEPNGEASGFNLPRDNGVAYAAQEAWIQSETIKENILFGKPYEKVRYEKVIYQCCLERDLDLFEAGDATEVGEKGLTLSGGQKARIALARAVYSDATILLLDDVLAALDVHTTKFIVDNCLGGDLLQGRTIILVTHNVAMITPIADFIISLGHDGRVVAREAVSEALAEDNKPNQDVKMTNEAVEKVGKSVDVGETGEDNIGKLFIPEEIPLGHVGWPALKMYLSSLGGIYFWVAAFGGLIIAELTLSFSIWFLGHWASQYGKIPGWAVPVAYYLSIYALILLFAVVVYWVAFGAFILGSVKAARTIHRNLINSVLGTTLRWLDTVPTARIIARCTQDIHAIDGPINQSLTDVNHITILMVVKFCAAIIFVPVFIVPGIAAFIVGGLFGQLYIKAQLSIKREMSNRRSPVLAHFGAAISGLTSIRAFGVQAMFRSESLRRINAYTRPARAFYNCNLWICVRAEVIGGLFAAGLAAVLVYGRGSSSASDTGFSLTMAAAASAMILLWIRDLNEFEVQGNSLERIEGYINVEQEVKPRSTGIPPAYWPASGDLKVENLSARYSIDGPKVLHNVSFEIKSGERVGVVGRTGSGKSSLTLSLLRCIPTEGSVIFDGLPIDTINLDALRSNITIIPQQPQLLSGTLRENLDPFSEHSDLTLNDALRTSGLFSLQDENDISKLTLDSYISSGGGNLSVGQRQILALARAVVRQSKLLILDEATSAIDYATDNIIQNTLREVLKDATLITVAHRLQTIMDADKILVLDAGEVVEFDSPANLLRTDGYFRSLVNESGDKDALWEMAQKGEEGNASNDV